MWINSRGGKDLVVGNSGIIFVSFCKTKSCQLEMQVTLVVASWPRGWMFLADSSTMYVTRSFKCIQQYKKTSSVMEFIPVYMHHAHRWLSASPVLVSFTAKDSFPLTQTAATDSTQSCTLNMLVFMLLKMQRQVDCTSGGGYIYSYVVTPWCVLGFRTSCTLYIYLYNNHTICICTVYSVHC